MKGDNHEQGGSQENAILFDLQFADLEDSITSNMAAFTQALERQIERDEKIQESLLELSKLNDMQKVRAVKSQEQHKELVKKIIKQVQEKNDRLNILYEENTQWLAQHKATYEEKQKTLAITQEKNNKRFAKAKNAKEELDQKLQNMLEQQLNLKQSINDTLEEVTTKNITSLLKKLANSSSVDERLKNIIHEVPSQPNIQKKKLSDLKSKLKNYVQELDKSIEELQNKQKQSDKVFEEAKAEFTEKNNEILKLQENYRNAIVILQNNIEVINNEYEKYKTQYKPLVAEIQQECNLSILSSMYHSLEKTLEKVKLLLQEICSLQNKTTFVIGVAVIGTGVGLYMVGPSLAMYLGLTNELAIATNIQYLWSIVPSIASIYGMMRYCDKIIEKKSNRLKKNIQNIIANFNDDEPDKFNEDIVDLAIPSLTFQGYAIFRLTRKVSNHYVGGVLDTLEDNSDVFKYIVQHNDNLKGDIQETALGIIHAYIAGLIFTVPKTFASGNINLQKNFSVGKNKANNLKKIIKSGPKYNYARMMAGFCADSLAIAVMSREISQLSIDEARFGQFINSIWRHIKQDEGQILPNANKGSKRSKFLMAMIRKMLPSVTRYAIHTAGHAVMLGRDEELSLKMARSMAVYIFFRTGNFNTMEGFLAKALGIGGAGALSYSAQLGGKISDKFNNKISDSKTTGIVAVLGMGTVILSEVISKAIAEDGIIFELQDKEDIAVLGSVQQKDKANSTITKAFLTIEHDLGGIIKNLCTLTAIEQGQQGIMQNINRIYNVGIGVTLSNGQSYTQIISSTVYNEAVAKMNAANEAMQKRENVYLSDKGKQLLTFYFLQGIIFDYMAYMAKNPHPNFRKKLKLKSTFDFKKGFNKSVLSILGDKIYSYLSNQEYTKIRKCRKEENIIKIFLSIHGARYLKNLDNNNSVLNNTAQFLKSSNSMQTSRNTTDIYLGRCRVIANNLQRHIPGMASNISLQNNDKNDGRFGWLYYSQDPLMQSLINKKKRFILKDRTDSMPHGSVFTGVKETFKEKPVVPIPTNYLLYPNSKKRFE